MIPSIALLNVEQNEAIFLAKRPNVLWLCGFRKQSTITRGSLSWNKICLEPHL
jgi:hypothetical protein